MAVSGEKATDQWNAASTAASTAFTRTETCAEAASKAIEQVSSSTDHWTSAVGAYDKAAMEMSYSTEELVELGYKSKDALTEQAKASEEAADAFERSLNVTESFKAATAELEADLEKLQDAYIGTAIQFGKNSDEAKALQAEIQELSKVIDENKNEFSDLQKEANGTGSTVEDAIKTIQSALAAAGIAKLVNEITTAAKEMAYEFSNSSAVVSKATGAAGSTLEDLNKSVLKIYGSEDDAMESIAGAVGEINTRLGLQGDQLEHVTSLFMDYSRITGSNVVGAVQNVTKVMKNWNVDVENTEALLDKLSAAGQMSGASVDQLSNMVVLNKATLQQLGYDLDSSIALLSMFEYEGLNASTIMMGFRSAVTSFTNDGKDAAVAMQDVITEIGSMASESEATALAIETFGSRAGAELAFAIRNGKFEIQDWTSAIGSANGTLSKTADASLTLEEKWLKASNSIGAAFSSVVAPAVDDVSSGFAAVVGGIGDFLQEHPLLTTALTAIAGVLAAAATAVGALIAAYSIKMALMPVLTGQVTIFGVALNAAIWPITLIVGAIAALVAVGTVLFSCLNDVDEEWASLTATSKQNYEAVEALNAEYELTVECMGESSDSAKQLAADLEAARAVYEASKFTIEDFIAQNDKLVERQQKLTDSYDDTMDSIKFEEDSFASLTKKLEELQSKTSLTAVEQQQMTAIVDKLNNMVPDLALAYDDVSGSLSMSVEEMRKMAKAQADLAKQQKQAEAYAEAIAQQTELEEQLAEAKRQVAAAEENKFGWGWFGESKQSHEDLETFIAEEERLQEQLNENNRIIREAETAWAEAAKAAEEAAKAEEEAVRIADELAQIEAAAHAYENAVHDSIIAVSEDLQGLIKYYDDTYEAARKSLDGTCGLFEKVEEKAGLSSKRVMDAWQSQIDFFNEYNDNLSKLKDFNINTKVLEQLSDGSTESAGQVKALVDELEKLSPEKASKRIQELNSKFSELYKAKDDVAQAMTDIQTSFDSKLKGIEFRMQDSIDNMSLEEEAAAAAKDTISAYIRQIESMTDQTRSAALGVAKAATSVLGDTPMYTEGIPGYVAKPEVTTVDAPEISEFASGTNYAPKGLALVGEEGPELVRFNGGEQVFTADETDKIFAKATNIDDLTFGTNQRLYVNPDDTSDNSENDKRSRLGLTEEKKIVLDINGTGSLSITGVDEETVWDIVSPKLKDAFMGIIRTEIFEEGDLAYDF